MQYIVSTRNGHGQSEWSMIPYRLWRFSHNFKHPKSTPYYFGLPPPKKMLVAHIIHVEDMDQVWSSNIQPLGWVNYNISLTWNKTILGSFPLLTMISLILSEVQWGRDQIYPEVWSSHISSHCVSIVTESSPSHSVHLKCRRIAVAPGNTGWWFHGRISTANCCRISQPFKLRKPWSIYRSSGWEILQLVVSVFRFPYPICVPSFSLMRDSPFLKMMIF